MHSHVTQLLYGAASVCGQHEAAETEGVSLKGQREGEGVRRSRIMEGAI